MLRRDANRPRKKPGRRRKSAGMLKRVSAGQSTRRTWLMKPGGSPRRIPGAPEKNSVKRKRKERRVEDEFKNAEEKRKKAEEARTAADKVAQETREQLEEVQRSVRNGIKPVLIPTLEELNATKKRLQYQEGLFHFAVAGIAGSGQILAHQPHSAA